MNICLQMNSLRANLLLRVNALLAVCAFGAVPSYPPNIPPKKEPEDLTFLSASAISWIASFSFPELSISSPYLERIHSKVEIPRREFRCVYWGLQSMGLFCVGVYQPLAYSRVAYWEFECFTWWAQPAAKQNETTTPREARSYFWSSWYVVADGNSLNVFSRHLTSANHVCLHFPVKVKDYILLS